MAQIYPQPSQGQATIPQQGFPSPGTQDPLFEALAKYITSGPGPSSVTDADIQQLLDSHTSHPDGRAYLESIVAPPVADPFHRVWRNSVDVSGFITTNLSSWTLNLSGSGVGVPHNIQFRVNGAGIFMPQVQEFQNAKFYWDDVSNIGAVHAKISVKGGQVHVEIFQGDRDVNTPEEQAIADFSFSVAHLRLPPIAFGKGTLFISQ